MRRAVRMMGICMLIPALASQAAGTNDTPSSASSFLCEPYAFANLNSIPRVQETLLHQGYTDPVIVVLYDMEADTVADVTLERFAYELRQGHGVFYLFTHGHSLGPAVEAYGDGPECLAARDSAWARYAAAGWDTVTYINRMSTEDGFDIGVYPEFIGSAELGFVSNSSLVYVAACESFDYVSSWTDARAYLGYEGTTHPIDAVLHNLHFWGALNGESYAGGKAVRAVARAKENLPISLEGAGNTVLAPTVLDYDPSVTTMETENPWFLCDVHFDCSMNTSCTEWLVSVDGVIDYVDQVAWANDTTLSFRIRPSGMNGAGAIYIDPFHAVSAGNCACLDGNTDPQDTDGCGPNRDQFVFEYYFNDDTGASLSSFRVENAEVVWRTTEEIGTLAYRLLGWNGNSGDSWQVVCEDQPARGAPSEYRVPIPVGWDCLKLQEQEQRYWGTRWIDHDVCVTNPPSPIPREERRCGPRWLRVIGLEENVGPIEEFLARMDSVGVHGDYEIVPSISESVLGDVFSPEHSVDTLKIIWPRPERFELEERSRGDSKLRMWGVGLVGPSEFDSVLAAYEVALEEPSHWPPDEGYWAATYLLGGGPGDSLAVAEWIRDEHNAGDYWILFGKVLLNNRLPETTTPCPYLTNPGRPVPPGHWFSLWDWECGSVDTMYVEKHIGYVPVDDEYEAWDYLDKMIEYRWNTVWNEYIDRVGTWALDQSFGPGSGAYVRTKMDSLLEIMDPSWEVDSLWASGIPYETGALADSAVAALADGRALVVTLGTMATHDDLCLFLSSDPDNPSFVNVESALGYTYKYTQLLSMCCDLHDMNGSSGNPPIVKQLLNVPMGGVMVSVGPSTNFYQDYYYEYTKTFLEIYEQFGGNVSIGLVHAQVRNTLLDRHPEDPLMHLFCKVLPLVGDPTMHVGGPKWDLYNAVDDSDETAPSQTVLGNPVPNPFNPTVSLSFSLPGPTRVSLRIFDVQGRLVRTLVSGPANAGEHQVLWDGKNDRGETVGSGVYFCELVSGEHRRTTKLVLLR